MARTKKFQTRYNEAKGEIELIDEEPSKINEQTVINKAPCVSNKKSDMSIEVQVLSVFALLIVAFISFR